MSRNFLRLNNNVIIDFYHRISSPKLNMKSLYTFISNAAASFCILFNDILLVPLSTALIYVLWRPEIYANFSCDNPFACLYFFIDRPNCLQISSINFYPPNVKIL